MFLKEDRVVWLATNLQYNVQIQIPNHAKILIREKVIISGQYSRYM